MKRVKTKYVGVYTREGLSRLSENGTPDICYDITYKKDGKTIFEKIGWESEGYTAEDAIEIRGNRVKSQRHPELALNKQNVTIHVVKTAKRVKTKYVGVYTREGTSRLAGNGKADICYDITYKKDGKTIFEKIGWRSEGYTAEDAVELRGKRVKSQRHPDLASNKISQITLEEAWELYRTRWLPTIKSAKALQRRYELHIKSYFKRRTLQSITKSEIQQFTIKLLNKTVSTTKAGHLSAGTVSKVIELLNSLYSKMAEWEYLAETAFPTKNIKIPNSKMKRERYLQPQEAIRLLEHLERISSQYYFIAKIGIYTGMRLQEILSLTTAQIDLSARIMSIDGKTGNRAVFIAEPLIPDLEKLMSEALDGLLIHMNGQPITRTAATKRFIRIFDAMGLNDGVTEKKNKLVFHSLRHTFCSWLAMQGVSLYTIGSLAGHSNTDTTQRYAKLSASVQHEALKGIQNMLESGNEK